MIQPLNALERKALQSTSLTAKYIHLSVCIAAFLFYLSIWLDYIVEGNHFTILIKYFSIWNVIIGTGVSFYGIFLTLIIIMMIRTNEISKWIGVFEIVRDCLYLMNLLLYILVDIAFWIAYYYAPYYLSWASLASHSIHLLVILAMIFTTNVRTTIWSLVASLYTIALYITFHVWYYYRFGQWIYESLNFTHGFLWVVLVVGIPIGIVIVWGLLYIANHIKNRLAAKFLGIKYFSHHPLIDYYHPENSAPKKKHFYGQTALENFRIRMAVPAFFELLIVIVMLTFTLTTRPNQLIIHWSMTLFITVFSVFIGFKFFTYAVLVALVHSQTPRITDQILHHTAKQYFKLFISATTLGFSILIASTLLCIYTQWYDASFCFYITLLLLEGVYLLNRILALYSFYIGFRLSRDHYDDIVNETYF